MTIESDKLQSGFKAEHSKADVMFTVMHYLSQTSFLLTQVDLHTVANEWTPVAV